MVILIKVIFIIELFIELVLGVKSKVVLDLFLKCFILVILVFMDVGLGLWFIVYIILVFLFLLCILCVIGFEKLNFKIRR